MISFSTLKYAVFLSRLAVFRIGYNTFPYLVNFFGKIVGYSKSGTSWKIFDIGFDEKFILKIRQPNYNRSRLKTSAMLL